MKIALISHDGKKADMVAFLLENREFLGNASLVATGTTGGHIEKAGLKVDKMLSGPLGGDAQIASWLRWEPGRWTVTAGTAGEPTSIRC